CSMVASRLVLILDDLLWALTDAQLVAAIHLWHSLSVLVRRSAAQRRRAAPPPAEPAPRGAPPRTHSPLVEFFRHHDVLETSYHLFCTRIDLHLCDDMDPKETRSSWPPLQGGGALQVVLEKLLVDYYPFHGVASPRAQWLKYSEPSSGRQAWVQQLLSRWAEGSRHAVLQRAPPHGATPPQDGGGSPSSNQLGDWRCLMSSCLLVRLEEFAMQQKQVDDLSRPPIVDTQGLGTERDDEGSSCWTRQETAREALYARDTDVALIPGGCTSILQPTDVSWMKPFEDALCERWAVFFQASKLTPEGNPKRLSRQNVVDFVAEAWASLSEDTVRRSFKRCGISTSLDGTEDSELNDRLASVDDAAEAGPREHESLVDEALDLISDSGSDVSFNGVSDVD
ncbi:UHRF1-binding protein 1-like, partial [Ixodes scapularis]